MTRRPPHQQPSLAVGRVADVQLRGRTGPLAARAYWPPPAVSDVPPALLVLFPGEGSLDGLEGVDALCRGLSSFVGVVVLAVSYRSPTAGAGDAADPFADAVQDAITATDWAADHAGELGADPRRLVVAGQAGGGEIAAAAAQHAREQGWPPIMRQVAIGPDTRLEDLARSLGYTSGAPRARAGRQGSAPS